MFCCCVSCSLACSVTDARGKRKKLSGRRNSFVAKTTSLTPASKAVKWTSWSMLIEGIDDVACHCAVVVRGRKRDATAAWRRVSDAVRSCSLWPPCVADADIMVDMVDIQSAAAEIRRGIKKRKIEEEEDRKKPQGKNIMVCPIT